MPENRLTQLAEEVVITVNPKLGITQIAEEFITTANPRIGMSQLAIEIVNGAFARAMMSQLAIELVVAVSQSPGTVLYDEGLNPLHDSCAALVSVDW